LETRQGGLPAHMGRKNKLAPAPRDFDNPGDQGICNGAAKGFRKLRATLGKKIVKMRDPRGDPDDAGKETLICDAPKKEQKRPQ